jgi:hypothetical protein
MGDGAVKKAALAIRLTRQAGFVCSIVGIPRNWAPCVRPSAKLQRQWPQQCHAGENQADG